MYKLNTQHGGRVNPKKLWQTHKVALVAKLTDDDSFDGDLSFLPENFAPEGNNFKYTEWIIISYINGGIQLYEDIKSRVYPALDEYSKLLKKGKLSQGEPRKPWTDETNINNFCGLSGCFIKNFEKKGIDTLLDKYNEKKGEEPMYVDPYYEGTQIDIYIPKTKKEACYYGHNTKWCTATEKSKNMFRDYNKSGKLYVIVPKKPKYKGEKYQLHFEREQYKDEKDKNVNLRGLVLMYKEVLHVIKFGALIKFIEESNYDYEDYEIDEVILIALDYGLDINSDNCLAIRNSLVYSKIHTFLYLFDQGVRLDPISINLLNLTIKHIHNSYYRYKIILLLLNNKVSANEGALAISAGERDIELIKLLLNHGADIHHMNEDALLNAVKSGDMESVSILLEIGAKPNALAFASSFTLKNLDIAKLLLKYGLDIKIVGGELLEEIIYESELDQLGFQQWEINKTEEKIFPTVKLLVENGANIHHNKNAIFRICKEFGYTNILKYLERVRVPKKMRI